MNARPAKSTVVGDEFQEYLNDSRTILNQSFDNASNSAALKGVYKVCFATYAICARLSRNDLVLLKAGAEIARRIPFLVACRQRSLTCVELRRFIELATWYPYFSEHDVEWREFIDQSGAGFTRNIETPIAYCAHRERAFYSNYVKERFRKEKSGIVVQANATLSQQYKSLSFHVHGLSHATGIHSFTEVVEAADIKADSKLQATVKSILTSGCILMTSTKPQKIHKLPAYERAWFDWLVGEKWAKDVRSGKYCAD